MEMVPAEWACPICGTDLSINQPVAPSCPANCPLRDNTTVPEYGKDVT